MTTVQRDGPFQALGPKQRQGIHSTPDMGGLVIGFEMIEVSGNALPDHHSQWPPRS